MPHELCCAVLCCAVLCCTVLCCCLELTVPSEVSCSAVQAEQVEKRIEEGTRQQAEAAPAAMIKEVAEENADLKTQLAAALGQNKVCILDPYCACSEILSFPLALYNLELGWWA